MWRTLGPTLATRTWMEINHSTAIIRFGTIIFPPEMRMRRDASGHVLISLWGPVIGTSSGWNSGRPE
ncbi:uncharacterized protein ARMOST_19226 [Armillaria ostoyae]|uniref:Uncharacterized protein n=1 Tax=Armillaria ostoyae TaxID=47428 RepID=A0A284S3Y6_ARMOS|nr:uncharacterized protein ARMOST_19226 [Armillaria ostoyae]